MRTLFLLTLATLFPITTTFAASDDTVVTAQPLMMKLSSLW
ncbi:hypothetical protein JCM19240_4526 [Vibrio maritimus]|uniref:Uncharacterized protein n=1 Tax=Vibrio maritimus TaxID=990268 RepID=A0A090TGV3_9VIBR|nr:hypothetical protein JCM19240_4526 [Vibrio maritimus]